MDYYPIFVDLRNRCCLVVGEGKLSDRKVEALHAAGAEVIRSRHFDGELARRAFLVVADVSEEEAESIRRFGEDHRVFVNIVDKTRYCSFIVPAILERGELMIAISSSGKSPALSSWIRRRLEHQFGAHYAWVVNVLGETRDRVKCRLPSYSLRKAFYRQVLDEGLVETARIQGRDGVRRQLEDSLARHGT